MEEQNDKLSEFLKNKLESSNLERDDWFRPDPLVWANAQAQLDGPPALTIKQISLWLGGALAIFFLLLVCFFGWQLIRQNQDIEERLNEQTKVIAELETRLIQSIEEQKIQKREVQEEQMQARQKDVSQKIAMEKLKSTQARIIQENQYITKQYIETYEAYTTLLENNKEKSHLPNLSNENKQIIKDEVASLRMNEDELEKIPEALAQINFSELLSSAVPIMDESLNSWAPNPTIQLTKRAKKKAKFEIGMNYGLTNLKASTRSFVSEDDDDDEDLFEEFPASIVEVGLAYGLNANWWIKTGIRHAIYSSDSGYEFEVEYDELNDRFDNDGNKVNDIQLQLKNDLFPSTQNLAIGVNDSPNLSTGDLLFGEIFEEQTITLWQFPLGIEYRNDNNKLDWQVAAGPVLNRLKFETGTPEAAIYNSDKEFTSYLLDKEYESDNIKYLLGIQASLGLHYELNKKIIIRGDLLFQYNKYIAGQSYQLGISYQL